MKSDIAEFFAGLAAVIFTVIGLPILYIGGFVLAGFLIAALAACFWFGITLGWSFIAWLFAILIGLF